MPMAEPKKRDRTGYVMVELGPLREVLEVLRHHYQEETGIGNLSLAETIRMLIRADAKKISRKLDRRS